MLDALGPRRAILDHVSACAQDQGVQACLVGGAIVDLLLDRPVKDLDIVVVGDAPTLGKALRAQHGGELLIHRAFHTATWTPVAAEPVDLVTARSERYRAPAALPEVLPGSLQQDLARRDFTVLAMALDLATGRLTDPANGQQDLSDRVLRIQHPQSFHDDPTRIWRAARWAARLDLEPSRETLQAAALARTAGAHQALSIERLGQEVHRCLADGRCAELFGRVHAWGWLGDVHPSLGASTGSRLSQHERQTRPEHLARGGEPYGLAEGGWLTLARLLPSRSERASLERLIPGGGARRALWLEGPEQTTAALAALQTPSPGPVGLGRALRDLPSAVRAQIIAEADPGWLPLADWWEQTGRRLRSSVDGHQLITAGVTPGPSLGRGLQAALEASWLGLESERQWEAALAAAAL